MDIYLFDRAFRSILMHYLEIIEVKFKTSYAYYFSEYCQSGDCYTHIDCYTNFWEAVESLNSIMQTTKRLSNEEAYIKHHMVNKKEFPIWVLVESATFGGISKLYSHTRPEIQSKIADHFQYPGKKGPDILKSVIHRLAVLRNACAHESRLFNKPIAIKPPLMKADKKYLPDPRTGDAGVWGDILTMRRFLSQQEFSAMINNIKEIHRQYPFVAMEHYKFHPDWEVLFT